MELAQVMLPAAILALPRIRAGQLQALAADREVLGADVKTFRALEGLIERLGQHSRSRFEALRAAIRACR